MNALKFPKFNASQKSRSTFFAGLFLLAACAAAPVSAGTLMDVKVVDRSTGQVLPTWRHRGQLYVVGTPGNRYAVQVANRSSGRVLSVISVDGVNVLSGETAAAPQSGYVLAPGQSADIAGWRKSMEEVAAFYFTSVTDSYAGRTGRPENTGVIGVAVFREQLPPPVTRPQPAPLSSNQGDSRDAASVSAPAAPAFEGRAKGEMAESSASAQRAEKKLGTGHGERLNAPTEYTRFERASSVPAEVITVYYDSRANLIARGVIPNPRYNVRPNPFPGGFVPDPQG
jgi:hypothetical protein